MNLFNKREKELLSNAFLECTKELPSDEELQDITFSDGFEKRMARAIRRKKTKTLRLVTAACACVAVIITSVGYFARPYEPIVAPPYTQSENSTDSSIVPIELKPENLKDFADEFFIAKVTSNPKKTVDLYNDFDLPNQNENLIPTLCNVKITKVIASDMVSEGKKIKVFNYVYDFGKSYAKTLEKGKTYLFATCIEPHNDTAAAVVRLAAEIDGDKLIYMNSFTEDMLKNIDTLTQFLENEHVKELKEIKKDTDDSGNFYRNVIKTKDKIYTYKNDREYFKERVKKALSPCSKKVFTRITRVNDEFYNDLFYNDSVFTAKVIKRERVIDAGSFADSEWIPTARLVGTPAIYHVEIEDNMWSFFEGNPTVKLVFYENGEQLEVGKTYLFSAQSQPFENSAVLVETQTYTAKVDGKKLIPITETSKFNLEGLDTFKKLKDSNNYLALTLEIYSSNDSPNNDFNKYIAKQGDTEVTIDGLGHPESDYFEFQKIIADAITVGSDAVITKMEG